MRRINSNKFESKCCLIFVTRLSFACAYCVCICLLFNVERLLYEHLTTIQLLHRRMVPRHTRTLIYNRLTMDIPYFRYTCTVPNAKGPVRRMLNVNFSTQKVEQRHGLDFTFIYRILNVSNKEFIRNNLH
jgi:hypothetical protein